MDPFGHDAVDIPLEKFCEAIESQIKVIDQRGRSGISKKLAKSNDRSSWQVRRESSVTVRRMAESILEDAVGLVDN